MQREFASGEFYGVSDVRAERSAFKFSSLRAVGGEDVVQTHSHADAHFVLVLSGGYISTAHGAPDVACAPALVFNPIGVKHRDRFLGGAGRFLAISVDASAARAVGGLEAEGRAVSLSDVFAIHAARLIERELRRPGGSTLVLEAAAWQLLDAASHKTDRSAASPPAWLRIAQEMIRDSNTSRMGVREVADYVNVHPVHLARVFRRFLGCTPGEYLKGRRLERAATLLGGSVAALADVAIDSGFVDQSHMNKAFRSAFALTPGGYRRARMVASVQYEKAPPR
jgi:AraC family transcriptional regulator